MSSHLVPISLLEHPRGHVELIATGPLGKEQGLTLIELLIGLIVLGIVTSATFKFYSAQHELYLAQADIADRQGNLRYATDEIGRSIRNAGYGVSGPGTVRVSATFDTLQVYRGAGAGAVDTISYYIDRSQDQPFLTKKVNAAASTDLAQGIDSAHFLAIGVGAVERVSFILVSVEQTQHDNSALKTRRRLGETINIRNR
jgi:prepilin-type N-terminal cleavage/methylation domain-containing protein